MASVPTVLPRMTTAPGSRTRGHAVLAEEDVVELLAVADGQEDRVGTLGGFAGRGEGGDAGFFGELQAGLGDVEAVDGQLGGQAGGHGQAHGAKAQDGDGVVAGHGVLRLNVCGGLEGAAELAGDLGQGVVVAHVAGEDDVRDALGGSVHRFPEADDARAAWGRGQWRGGFPGRGLRRRRT